MPIAEGIENIIINVGTDPDLVDLVRTKAKRKGFYFSEEGVAYIKAVQARGEDQYIRLRFDFTSDDTHHTGYGGRGIYFKAGRLAWGPYELCRSVMIFDLERELNWYAERPQNTYIALGDGYNAEVKGDGKTVKVEKAGRCDHVFDADKVHLVSTTLKDNESKFNVRNFGR